MDSLTVLIKEAVRDAVKEAMSEERSLAPIAIQKSEKLITAKELCEHLAVTEQTITKWKQKGKIPFYEIGTAARFNLKEVLKALEK